MSLREAVIEVMTEMEQESKHAVKIHQWVKMLRIALKASEDDKKPETLVTGKIPPIQPIQHLAKDALETAKKESRISKMEEEMTPRQVEVIGLDEILYVPLDAAAPVGCKTRIAGKICELRADGKLHVLESS